jgi:hypothetical protein
MMPAFYLVAVGAVGLVTMLTIRETRGINLLKDDFRLTDAVADAAAEPSAPSR